MAGQYRYVIGPVVEQVLGGLTFYAPPESCVSWIDLRRMSEQSSLGQLGCGFFTMPPGWSIPSGYHWLGGGEGDCRSLYLTAEDQSAWASLIGVTPTRTASTTLIDALDETLTDLADPSGENAPKPLVPGALSGPPAEADIILGGHSRVRRRKVPAAGRWWNNLVALAKRDVQAIIDRDPHDKLWRKYVGSLSHKYHGRWDDERGNDFIPDKAKKDREPTQGGRDARRWAMRPETTYTDEFDRADASTLGGSWTNYFGGSGEIGIASNAAYFGKSATWGGGVPESSRYDADVSSSDHVVGMTLATFVGLSGSDMAFGPVARFSSSGETCYAGVSRVSTSFGSRLVKIMSGTLTELATTVGANADGDLAECEPDGSVITMYVNGGARLSLTDTAISAGTRGGVVYYSVYYGAKAYGNDWSIADLAAAATSNCGLLLLGVGA